MPGPDAQRLLKRPIFSRSVLLLCLILLQASHSFAASTESYLEYLAKLSIEELLRTKLSPNPSFVLVIVHWEGVDQRLGFAGSDFLVELDTQSDVPPAIADPELGSMHVYCRAELLGDENQPEIVCDLQ